MMIVLGGDDNDDCGGGGDDNDDCGWSRMFYPMFRVMADNYFLIFFLCI